MQKATHNSMLPLTPLGRPKLTGARCAKSGPFRRVANQSGNQPAIRTVPNVGVATLSALFSVDEEQVRRDLSFSDVPPNAIWKDISLFRKAGAGGKAISHGT